MQDTRIFVVFSQYYRSVVNQVEKVPDQQKHGRSVLKSRVSIVRSIFSRLRQKALVSASHFSQTSITRYDNQLVQGYHLKDCMNITSYEKKEKNHGR